MRALSHRRTPVLAMPLAALVAASSIGSVAAQPEQEVVTVIVETIVLARQDDGTIVWAARDPAGFSVDEPLTVEDFLSGDDSRPADELSPDDLDLPEMILPDDHEYLPAADLLPDRETLPGADFLVGGADDAGAATIAFPDACTGRLALIAFTATIDPLDRSILATGTHGVCLDIDPDTASIGIEGAVEPLPDEMPAVETEADSGAPSDDGPATEGSSMLPRFGRWQVTTSKGRMRCGGFSQKVPRQKDIGLIVAGADDVAFILQDSDGSKPTEMRPHRTKSDTYVGTSGKSQRGASIEFDYTLRVASPTRINGSLRGKADLNGVRCDFREQYRATFVGG